jgi:glycosyltransferase involved in cell wall biosynthesis
MDLGFPIVNTQSPSNAASPDASKPLVSVMVMAWNEAAALPAVVREIHAELQRLGASFEILPGLRVCHHGDNRGLGGVYRTGFAEARGDLVTFFPADGQFPASIIGDYLPAMADTDMILGVLPDRGGSLLARALSLGERLLLRVLFSRFPRFQGILMFRRELLRDTPLHSRGRGWTVLMEFILRKARAGVRIKNIPITIRPRASGSSKVNNLRSIVSNLRQVLALRLHI